MKKVSRSEILEQLGRWGAGKLSPVDMHKWAADLLSSGELEFDDVEGPQAFSAAKETMSELEMLDMNMVIQDDIPIFVEFLNAPAGGFEAGYINFVATLQQIDRKARSKKLKTIEPYARHC